MGRRTRGAGILSSLVPQSTNTLADMATVEKHARDITGVLTKMNELKKDLPPIGGRRKTLRTKFDHCVKAVRKTVKARKGSNAESAAIAICTKTILHPRGRTLKNYRKGRLLTQKKRL